MRPRLEEEFRILKIQYPDLEHAPSCDWFVIQQTLPSGWNKEIVRLLVQVPVGYPASPPDNFYTDPDLRLANGNLPGNTSNGQIVAGQTWLQFSYHLEPHSWHSHVEVLKGHNLMTFLDGVKNRLSEVS